MCCFALAVRRNTYYALVIIGYGNCSWLRMRFALGTLFAFGFKELQFLGAVKRNPLLEPIVYIHCYLVRANVSKIFWTTALSNR